MKRIKISAAIVGAALSVGALSLAPVEGAAQARTSYGACLKFMGSGRSYAVVAYPCALGRPGGLGHVAPHRKHLPAVYTTYSL